jgi:hypothetical protein
MRGGIQGLVGKSEGKKLLGRHRRRWEDNIKMDFFMFMGPCIVIIF